MAFGARVGAIEELEPRRRNLSLSVDHVELRLYRRTRTSAETIRRLPHFVYHVRCEWDGMPRQRPLRRVASPLGRPMSTGSSRSPRSGRWGDLNVTEPSWPWWDALPPSYVVHRHWKEIVKLHETLVNDLAYDQVQGCRLVKVRDPVLPAKADLEVWMQACAATGDACALSRQDRELDDDLDFLHSIYVENRLAPYFADVNRFLREVPTEALARSAVVQRFAIGGARSAAIPQKGPVPKRFLGPLVPVALQVEELAAGARALRKSRSAPGLRGQASTPSSPSGPLPRLTA